jgi:protein-S-isoprenylcysteine O-methyltransferase Ste14
MGRSARSDPGAERAPLRAVALVVDARASRRALLDASFTAKMALMVVAMLVTIAFQVAMHRNDAEEGARPGRLVSIIAATTLLLWIVVTLAGRARWMTAFLR